jgi:hypothetical protein
VRLPPPLSLPRKAYQRSALEAAISKYEQRLNCYAETGKSPEVVEREKEREKERYERRSGRIAWFVVLLLAALFFWWDRDSNATVTRDTVSASDDGNAGCSADDPGDGQDDIDMGWGDD